MHRRDLLASTVFAMISVSCKDGTLSSAEKLRDQLVGSWLWTDGDADVKSRSIVSLERDGSFREEEKIIAADGSSKLVAHAGEWFFDGLNFKRKYTKLNGVSLSNAKFEYMTYEVTSVEQLEFVGIDNVKKKTIRFAKISASESP